MGHLAWRYCQLTHAARAPNDALWLRRFILVSNHLPIRATKREEAGGWEFEWDEDALIYQAQVLRCAVFRHQPARLRMLGVRRMWYGAELLHAPQEGIEDAEVMYVGCLPVELDPDEQDVRSAAQCLATFACISGAPEVLAHGYRWLICRASKSSCPTQSARPRAHLFIGMSAVLCRRLRWSYMRNSTVVWSSWGQT